MIRRLEEASAEASNLAESEQETLAAWLLQELASERRWEQRLADSPGLLARLADEALVEHREQQSRPLVPKEL
jgi:hypothetical protein